MSVIISQHVCEHWNYRVCFVENGKCKNCGWLTPELEEEQREIREAKEDLAESKIKIKDPCDCVIQPCKHYDDEYMENNEYFDGEVGCIICGGEPDGDEHQWGVCKCPCCGEIVKSLDDQEKNHSLVGYKNPKTGAIIPEYRRICSIKNFS